MSSLIEFYRCRDCGYETEEYNELKHYDEHSGGFCPRCPGEGDLEMVEEWVTGDGSMAKAIANGQCPHCKCDMNGQMKCDCCGLEIRVQ